MSQISHPLFCIWFWRSQLNFTRLLAFSAVNVLFCSANLTALLQVWYAG
ncbi:hypothetical protein QUB13_05605 [Microcoleus sp. B4-D4]